MILVYLAGVVVFILAVLIASWEYWKASHELDFLPSAPNLPWIGTVMRTEDMYQFIIDLYQQFDYRFKMWVGPIALVFTGDRKEIGEILSSQRLITKSRFYKMISAWLGDSVVMATGEQWHHRRRLVTPAFHFSILKEYARVFEKYAQKLLDDVMVLTKKGRNAIDVQPLMCKWTMHIINETAMGTRANVADADYVEYTDAIRTLKVMFQQRWVRPWLFPDFLFRMSGIGKEFYRSLDTINKFIVKAINQKIMERKANKASQNVYRSFLDVILDAYDEDEIDVKGVLDEVNTFMFAGHETTSCALSFIIYELATHPEVQEKLHASINQHMRGVPSTANQFKKYGNIDYLEMVIKETMRLHPPIVQFTRLITEDTEINGRIYKKGLDMSVSAQAVQRNHNYWRDPDTFDPERFRAGETHNLYSFIPFSAGPRNCVGQKFAMWELRVLLCVLLSRYRVIAQPQQLDIRVLVTQIVENGLWINFEERENK